MTKTLVTRLPDDYIRNLKEIARKEQLDTSTIVRRLLAKAIEEWKVQFALEELRNHKISIGKAAEIANLSIWDMMTLAHESNIDWTGYTQEDVERL